MKKFIEFLERNNAWENFERNFIEQGTGVKNYKRNCKVLEGSEISYAFTWDKTKEGYKYWKNLNDLWRGENRTLKEQLLSDD